MTLVECWSSSLGEVELFAKSHTRSFPKASTGENGSSADGKQVAALLRAHS